MSVDPETPRNQYAKVEYKIRIVGRIPRHNGKGIIDEKTGFPKFRMAGTHLCAIDATFSHVAAMYAAGRLMDSIRQPFNASIIRAEMDALRAKNEANVSPEDFEKWKAEVEKKEKFDPLVNEQSYDPSAARRKTPRCPYLFQLAYKSIYVGNNPPYWCGAREESMRNGRTHVNYRLNLDGPRNVMGRSGLDSFSISETETWYLYIDISEPLAPRYAFMQRTDIVGCTQNHHSSRLGTQLVIFNAQHHATRFLIPESEYGGEGERFGEQPMERHIKTHRPSTHRTPLSPSDDKFKNDPEYQALIESRAARARAHPAVIRMKDFAWFREHDVLRPDGLALLQEVWSAAIDYQHPDDYEALSVLVHSPKYLDVARSATLTASEPSAPRYWEYPSPELSDMILTSNKLGPILVEAAVESLRGDISGESGVLARLASIEGTQSFAMIKAFLAQYIWNESAQGGSGLRDLASSWLKGDSSSNEQLEEEPWCLEDYDMSHRGDVDETQRPYNGMIMIYQGLCYRAAVSQELSRREGPGRTASTEESILMSDFEPRCAHPTIFSMVHSGAFSDGEYPGKPLGDVAHPAFDASQFPRLREDQIICALEDWSRQIWIPDLSEGEWDYERGVPVPLRTLNLSGCHYATRNTVRRALKAVPTITRIIMIGCVSFTETDLVLLSLDGTLDNVECILTSESLRATFSNPSEKIRHRDEVYNRARSLLPSPPNDQVESSLRSIPNIFFDSGSPVKFGFKYDSQVIEDYFTGGMYTRQPSHTFARPPSLGFHPVTHDVQCGPPRFSVVLASHYVAGAPMTGAALPRVPIDTGIDGFGTSSSGLTSVWRGIIDLLEFLGCNTTRNPQRWNSISWSLLVKACFSGPGAKWGEKSGLAGGGEFFGFPAYFKGGLGQANEEWIFAYQFRDTRDRVNTSWVNFGTMFLYPEEIAQDSWAFIRYGRDANPLSHDIPTVVLYDVRGFRQAVCPYIPIHPDEAKWIERVEDVLKNGTWRRHHAIVNVGIDRGMAEKGNPVLEGMREVMGRLSKPRFMKETPHELILLIERMMLSQMNEGKDVF
ncbi:hypothetical protein FRC12_014611 [Ceratobasidium sp. 428]|nr:hypothetical protein FRC12_014611 [Ceratobasidium sp. 428]